MPWEEAAVCQTNWNSCDLPASASVAVSPWCFFAKVQVLKPAACFHRRLATQEVESVLAHPRACFCWLEAEVSMLRVHLAGLLAQSRSPLCQGAGYTESPFLTR